MSDGSGSINLRSIGKQGANAPAFETGLGSDGYSYQYNPCYPFTSVITETQTLYDLAVSIIYFLLFSVSCTSFIFLG